MNKSSKLLKNSIGVSAATLASRLLGLLRVRLEATALGGGAVASVWFFSQIIPNLLRRILGEGALGTALIPYIADTERDGGITAARRHLAQILSLIGLILAAIVVVVSAAAWFCGRNPLLADSGFFGSERITGVCRLLPLIMPYTFFICLTGIIGAVLNYAGLFVRPALTALFFNICIIAGLSAGIFLDLPQDVLLRLLALLTPAAGAVQMVIMLWMLRICGRFPVFNRETFKDISPFRKVMKLAAPGIISGGALQISFIVDRVMALSIGDRAIPALTYVDRIVDLPIGLFAISLGTVLMASLTHAAADRDWDQVREQLNFSIRHVWFICAPMAAGVIFFHTEILRVLCLGGKYTLDDLEAARMVAVFYGMGIPLFCSVKVLLPAFYSRKDMKRPLYVSLAAISVNIIFNIILIFPLKQGGLALATVIASAVNNTVLLILLARDGFHLIGKTVVSIIKSIIFSLSASGVTWLALHFAEPFLDRYTYRDLLLLILTMSVFAMVYIAAAYVTSSAELREFVAILRRKKSAGAEKIS